MNFMQRVFQRSASKALDTQGSVFKALGGGVWFAAYTNNFEDREKQILSEAAHDRYIARVNAGFTPMPELWHWHIPGTRHGEAKSIGRAGHIVWAAGVFDNTPEGHAAETYYRKAKDIELSHGFTYPAWALKDGVYHDYNTFEISTLPPGKAANPYTSFKEIDMPMTEEQKASLRSLFGERAEDVINMASQAETAGKALEEAGARYKDFADVDAGKDDEPAPETSASATDALKSFVLDVVEAQADITEGIVSLRNHVDAAMTALSLEIKVLREERAALSAEVKALKTRLDLKPRRVDDTSANVVTDAAAATEVAERSSPDMEYDPLFPGMNVPLTKG
ncbi:hypothetical protein HC928_18100 [bacterium]|nr:hypothetical protein [bacterium]